MNPQQFAQKIKAKYPQYQNVDDLELTNKILAQYPQYRSQVKVPSERSQDISQTISAMKSNIEERADKFGEITSAEQRGEQGKIRSLFQKFGQGIGAASDIVGQTIIGAGKAVLPQKAEEAIAGAFQKGVEKVVEQKPVADLISKYEALKETNPSLARDIDSALGIGSLTLDLIGVGPAAKGTQIVGKTALRGGQTVVGGTARGVARGVGEVEGILTGTSQETLREAFNAVRRGGKQAEEFTKALRNQTTPEQIVDSLRGAIDEISFNKTNEFGKMLDKIGDAPVVTSEVLPSVVSNLEKFGVFVKNGKLDFSQSKFRTVPQAQTKLQATYDEIAKLGDNQNIIGVDTSRQALQNLQLTGDDASARAANAIITDARNSVKSAGVNSVPEYGQALKSFADDAEFLDEINRSLAAGDGKTIDTTFRRVVTSLRTNNEQRLALLKELDDVTEGALLSSIAGQQLSEIMPRGIFKAIAAGMAGGAIITGGLTATMLPTLVFASPRVVGEVIRALGMTAEKADIVIKAILDAKNTLTKIGVDKVINSSDESFSGAKSQTSLVGKILGKDIPNKQGGFVKIGKETDLLQEAKKYKSAEEFVNNTRNWSSVLDENTRKMLSEKINDDYAKLQNNADKFVKNSVQKEDVYHGTLESFDEFEKTKGLRGGALDNVWRDMQGFFFTKDKKIAQKYIDFWKETGRGNGKQGRIIEVKLNYTNPLNLKNKLPNELKNIAIEELNKYSGEVSSKLKQKGLLLDGEEYNFITDNNRFIEKAKELGFDAIHANNGHEIMVFDKSQIFQNKNKNDFFKSQLEQIWKEANKSK